MALAACSVAPGAPGASRVVYMCACVYVCICVCIMYVYVIVCDHVCVFMCVHVHNMSAYTYRANKGNFGHNSCIYVCLLKFL